MSPLVDEMAEVSEPGEAAPMTEEEMALEEERAQRAKEELMAKLDALGQSLAKTRAEAIAGRMGSGCEDEWLEDEEFYQGIDDANRGERANTTWRRKPAGQAEVRGETGTRSNVFPNITAPYCDAAAARIADMLLPTDDRSWGLKPTPIPELQDIADGKYPPQMIQAAQFEARGQMPAIQPMQGQIQPNQPMQAPQAAPTGPQVPAAVPGQPPQGAQQPAPALDPAKAALQQATQQALELIERANEKAEKAQTRIEDWHVECQWHAQVRLVIEDAARVGVGVLKGPVPMVKTRILYEQGQIQQVTEIKPGSKWLDPWNFYPDPSCGENIHNGSYTWERDWLTRKQLMELRDEKGYIKEQIELCLTEGAQRASAEYKPTPDQPITDLAERDKFEVWYYHGLAQREDIETMGCDCSDMQNVSVPVMLVMVNNRVIKAALNPIDSGDFPYDVFVWRRKSGHWTGIGVARQGRTAQRIVAAATRNLMDNAGIAAGPMLVFRQGVVVPADGVAGIGPRKVYYIAEDADEMIDATKAIGQIKVDMLVNELMEIIRFGFKLMEDVTGLPALLQGQMGEQKVDKVGIAQIMNNNGTAVLRRLAKLFDDRITEPHVRRYYSWLMQYGEDDEKGDYCIDARGSSALVERDIQNQQIPQLLQAAANPMFGIDPKKTMQEWLKSLHFDPKRFEYDDEKWQQIVENMAKGPQDPRMQVAQLKVEADQAMLEREQQFEAQQNERDRGVEIALAQLDQVAKGAELTAEQKNVLAKVKEGLAKVVITTNTQKQLSRESMGNANRQSFADRDHDTQKTRETNRHKTFQALKPPSEPKGRAKPGRAWQQ